MTTIIQFLLRSYKVLWIQLFLTQGSQSYRAIPIQAFTDP